MHFAEHFFYASEANNLELNKLVHYLYSYLRRVQRDESKLFAIKIKFQNKKLI